MYEACELKKRRRYEIVVRLLNLGQLHTLI
jgi:hypothetical protein